LFFFFYLHVDHRDLHSFPTRRSSDLDLLLMLVRELNIPFINLSKYKIDAALKEIIPERIARLYQIIPLSMLEMTLTVAISDPLKDRKSTRLNSSHDQISYAVFCLKKK